MMNFEHLKYVTVEGVIGVGKTTLARKLKEEMNARLFLEEFEENPFLSEFYRDAERFAFQTQLFFLLSRFRQQEKIIQYDLFNTPVVADYMFQKDRIFATLNLNKKEFSLYNMLAKILEREIARPDLAIYLRSTTNRLLKNISNRGRDYERDISPAYLDSLVKLYDEYFNNYSDTPVLIINMENLDFVKNDHHLKKIFAEISNHRVGRKHVVLDD